VSKCLLLS